MLFRISILIILLAALCAAQPSTGGVYPPPVKPACTATRTANCTPQADASGNVTGTLAVTSATQSANLVYAGPTTGSAAAPTFRSLVIGDLPTTIYTPDSENVVTITNFQIGIGSNIPRKNLGATITGFWDYKDGAIAFPRHTIPLPAYGSNPGRTYIATNANTATDCTSGGGTYEVQCYASASGWTNHSGGTGGTGILDYPPSGVAVSTGSAWGSSLTKSGNGTTVATTSGTLTAGKQATFDANGNVIASAYDTGSTGSSAPQPLYMRAAASKDFYNHYPVFWEMGNYEGIIQEGDTSLRVGAVSWYESGTDKPVYAAVQIPTGATAGSLSLDVIFKVGDGATSTYVTLQLSAYCSVPGTNDLQTAGGAYTDGSSVNKAIPAASKQYVQNIAVPVSCAAGNVLLLKLNRLNSTDTFDGNVWMLATVLKFS